jgi:hypothetical protein
MKRTFHVSFHSILLWIIVTGVLCVIIFTFVNACHYEVDQTFTVTGKEAVKSDKDSKYLVFTDVTTYEVEDSVIFWRWDSSDVYGRLAVGKTYRATLQGYRIPFFSLYPNIISPIEIGSGP